MESEAARLDAWVAQAMVRGQGSVAAEELPPLTDTGRHIIERNMLVTQFKRDQQLMSITQRSALRDERIRLAHDRYVSGHWTVALLVAPTPELAFRIVHFSPSQCSRTRV
jgi:hypothetical protein